MGDTITQAVAGLASEVAAAGSDAAALLQPAEDKSIFISIASTYMITYRWICGCQLLYMITYSCCCVLL